MIGLTMTAVAVAVAVIWFTTCPERPSGSQQGSWGTSIACARQTAAPHHMQLFGGGLCKPLVVYGCVNTWYQLTNPVLTVLVVCRQLRCMPLRW